MSTYLQRKLLRDQAGSLPLAILTAIIVGGLIIVLTSRTMLSTDQVRFDRDFQLAANSAEAALSQALTHIQNLPPGSTASSLDAQELGLPTDLRDERFTWQAERSGFGVWEITATGWHGDDVARTFEATATDNPDHFMAAFGRVGVRMVGNNLAASYPFVFEDGTWGSSGQGSIGSNGEVSIIGNSTADVVMLMGNEAECAPNVFDEAAQTCNGVEMQGFPTKLDFAGMIEDAADEIEDACAEGESLGAFDPDVHVLRTGETYCFDRFETDNHTTVDVVIDPDHRDDEGFVTDPARVYIHPHGVKIGNHNSINCAGCDPSNPQADSSALSMVTLADNFQVGGQSELAAAIRAPQALCSGNPSSAQADIYGSIICHQIGNSGSGSEGGWTFFFDERLLQLGGGRFEFSEIREEAPKLLDTFD